MGTHVDDVVDLTWLYEVLKYLQPLLVPAASHEAIVQPDIETRATKELAHARFVDIDGRNTELPKDVGIGTRIALKGLDLRLGDERGREGSGGS